MPIDYKLFAKKAVDYTLKGIDSILVWKEKNKPPYAHAFAGVEFPDPTLYKPKTHSARGPSIDESVRANYSTPVPQTGQMTAKEALYKLLML